MTGTESPKQMQWEVPKSSKGPGVTGRVMPVSVNVSLTCVCESEDGRVDCANTYRCEISRAILFCSTCSCIQQVLPPLAVQRSSCRFNGEFTTVQTVAFSKVSTSPPFVLCYFSLGQTLISRTCMLPRMTPLQGCKRYMSVRGRARKHAWKQPRLLLACGCWEGIVVLHEGWLVQRRIDVVPMRLHIGGVAGVIVLEEVGLSACWR